MSSRELKEKQNVIEKHLTFYYRFIEKKGKNKDYKEFKSDTLYIKLYDNLDFELIPLSSNDKNDQINQKKQELTNANNDPIIIITKLIKWYERPLNVYGFNDTNEIDEEQKMPNNINCDRNRKLKIYVWGSKNRKILKHKVDFNFDATVLYGRKSDIDWKLDGRSQEIQKAVRMCKGYVKFLTTMIKLIEENNYNTIGINCNAGRHRSVTCAIDLRKYYPKCDIIFMEL